MSAKLVPVEKLEESIGSLTKAITRKDRGQGDYNEKDTHIENKHGTPDD